MTDLNLFGTNYEQRAIPIEISVAPGTTSPAACTVEATPSEDEVLRAGLAGEQPRLRAAMLVNMLVRSRDAKGFANEEQLDGESFRVGYQCDGPVA